MFSNNINNTQANIQAVENANNNANQQLNTIYKQNEYVPYTMSTSYNIQSQTDMLNNNTSRDTMSNNYTLLQLSNNNDYLNSQYNINRLKRKYIIMNIKNRKEKQALTVPNNKYDLKSYLFFENDYIVIPENLLTIVSSIKCRNYDIYNIYIYNKNMKLYNEIMKKLTNSELKLNKKPSPLPQLSNLERQYLYKKRNESTNNLLQTKSVLYLLSNNYKLVSDLNSIHNIDTNNTTFFESYDAIPLARELSHIKGDNLDSMDMSLLLSRINNTNSLPSIIITENNNARNTKIFKLNDNTNTNTNPNNNTNTNASRNTSDNMLTAPYTLKPTQLIIPSAPPVNNMKCVYPEHHEITDKINYYNLSSKV